MGRGGVVDSPHATSAGRRTMRLIGGMRVTEIDNIGKRVIGIMVVMVISR